LATYPEIWQCTHFKIVSTESNKSCGLIVTIVSRQKAKENRCGGFFSGQAVRISQSLSPFIILLHFIILSNFAETKESIMADQKNIMQQCFVCKKDLSGLNRKEFNAQTHLPVCSDCKGTEAEKKAEKDALDSLAEGFVCGCI
jgi:hypothetical protein